VGTVEGSPDGRDPRGTGETHVLEVGAGGTALDAAEPTEGMTARLMMAAKDAA